MWWWILKLLQCTPDISWSCISRSHVGPHFLAPKSAVFFAKSRQHLWTQFVGDNFLRNLLTVIAFVPSLQETIFSRNQLQPRSVNVGWNTCYEMVSQARRSIDTSNVSQRRVRLIQCQCKSQLQIVNLGINNAIFNQIIAVWPRCLHPPSCPDTDSSAANQEVEILKFLLRHMHTKIRLHSWRKKI